MRLLVSDTGLYTYPDVTVDCGEPILADEHGDILTNPLFIVEVLSESTKDYDRGGKFHQYMHIPSLQEYLTVSQTGMQIDQHMLCVLLGHAQFDACQKGKQLIRA